MMEKVDGGLEILVHISAPSRGKDDIRYRAIARAYQSFEPINRLTLCNYSENCQFQASDKKVGAQPGAASPSSPEGLRSDSKTNFILEEEGSFDLTPPQVELLSESRVANSNWDRSFALDSPQVSFSSVLDNLDSPLLQGSRPSIKTPPPSTKHALRHVVTSNESSWKTPPSVIPDSQSPYNQAIPEFSSPTRILELYLQHFDNLGPSTDITAFHESSQEDGGSSSLLPYSSNPPSSPAQVAPLMLSSSFEGPLEVIRDTPHVERGGKSSMSTSIKRRYHSSPRAAALSGTRPRNIVTWPNRNHMPLHGVVDSIIDTPTRPATQTSPTRKRRKFEIPATRVKPLHNKVSKPSLQPRITPDEIHPPPPRTSLKGVLPPLISPDLQLLAVQLELARRYRPKSQTRLLRELERGYWRVSMVGWSKTVRDQAWVALSTYLGQGRAGWGVWCLRCDSRRALELGDKEASERHPNIDSHQAEGDDQLCLRMYCWGAVVGHAYLLLYLVSQRRVKGTGVEWVDGGGQVVIIMP